MRQDFNSDEVAEETLKDNWRSCHHVVAFNNALFTIAPMLLQQHYNESLESSSLSQEEQIRFNLQLMRAYDKSYQRIPPRFAQQAGHVRIDFLEDSEESDWEEQALAQLPETLQQLQAHGYALRDIAILVRKKKEASQVAKTLLTYKEEHPESPYRYDILSDEALYISSSPTVRFFIAVFRFLCNPRDKALRRLAVYSYRVMCGTFSTADSGQEQWASQLLGYARHALYELTEALFRLVADHISPSEQAFAQAFLDKVAEFTQKERADLNEFLKWWDESGCQQTIAAPEGQNAVRILTIHKSKGLGFKAVVLPFCGWELDHKWHAPTLWCQPKEAPFNQLPLVPIRYGKGLSITHFATDYFQERLNAYMDNLNTLYVGLTRAKEELVLFAPKPKAASKGKKEETLSSIGDLLWRSLQLTVAHTREGEALESLPAHFDLEVGRFEWGDWWTTTQKHNEQTVEEIPMERIVSISPDERLHLRLHGKSYFFDNTRRKHGTLMHEVLSRIRTVDDIRQAVEGYRMEGVINHEESTLLVDKLSRLLDTPEATEWYDGRYRVLNEVEILFGSGLAKRPDRVMLRGNEVVVIDYKFGQRKLKAHQAQVREYLRLIREMGYKTVSGYIWYVELGKIETVKP